MAEEWNPAGLKAWATSAISRASDPVEAGVRSLPDGEHEGTALHPFDVGDREAYLAQIRNHGSIGRLTHKGVVGAIRLSSLVGIQRTVNRERLAQHMRDPNLVPKGARAPGHGGLVDLPVVVKVGGRYWIHDGHHRLTRSKLLGCQTAKVRLVDLDAGK